MVKVAIVTEGKPITTEVFVDGKKLNYVQSFSFTANLKRIRLAVRKVKQNEKGKPERNGKKFKRETIQFF